MKLADVEAIHLKDRKALLADGRTAQITNMFDSDGEETDDPGLAKAAVIQAGVCEWLSVNLARFNAQQQART